MERIEKFLLAVQTAFLARCTSPAYRTLADTRRASESIDTLRMADAIAAWIPESVCPFAAAEAFMKWHWAPDFRENAPQWMADCHHEISDEELMGIVNRNGQEWIRTSEVVAEYLDKSGYKDRSDLRDFLSDDRYGHLDATLAQRVVDRLRQMVDRKDLIGEGNWGMPPAHPRFTRLKCT